MSQVAVGFAVAPAGEGVVAGGVSLPFERVGLDFVLSSIAACAAKMILATAGVESVAVVIHGPRGSGGGVEWLEVDVRVSPYAPGVEERVRAALEACPALGLVRGLVRGVRVEPPPPGEGGGG